MTTKPIHPLGICVLIHNVGHSDIVVVLYPEGYGRDSSSPDGFIARPKYHCFHRVCQELIQFFETGDAEISPVSFNSDDHEGRPQCVGFNFDSPVPLGQWRDFEVRDHPPLNVKKTTQVFIGSVIFSHLGALLPCWLKTLDLQREHELHASELDSSELLNEAPLLDFQLRIFLVSGPGTARGHRNATEEDNSTEYLARLMMKWIMRFFDGRHCSVRIFVSGNVFHYHENVKFIHDKLRPAIGDVRQEVASIHDEEWPYFFHVAIALADGTPARMSAISEGLRQFRPDTIHITTKHTLWYQYPNIKSLWTRDIDLVRYTSFETYPAQRVAPSREESSDVWAFDLVHQMKQWKEEILLSLEDADSEMAKFWLRKSHQICLAVVLVLKDGHPHFFRGVNMEVSMPTGSLCAERNAIGTALTTNPTIKRSHFKMVAVLALSKSYLQRPCPRRRSTSSLSVSFVSEEADSSLGSPNLRALASPPQLRQRSISSQDNVNPRGPCGSCQEWFQKLAEVNPNFQVVTFEDESCDSYYVKYFV